MVIGILFLLYFFLDHLPGFTTPIVPLNCTYLQQNQVRILHMLHVGLYFVCMQCFRYDMHKCTHIQCFMLVLLWYGIKKNQLDTQVVPCGKISTRISNCHFSLILSNLVIGNLNGNPFLILAMVIGQTVISV